MSKSRAVRELELTFRLSFARLDFYGNLARVALPSIALVTCVWLVTNSVDKLAGQLTFADIGIRFLGDFKVSISYALTAAAGAWALAERKLKGDTIKRLSARVSELEKKIDPGRTSSRLTERGTTRPED